MSSSDKLPNALAEMFICMGLDESTDLIPSDNMTDSNLMFDPFSTPLCPQTLAALSCHVALFPSMLARPDDTYPPKSPRRSSAAFDTAAVVVNKPSVAMSSGSKSASADKGLGQNGLSGGVGTANSTVQMRHSKQVNRVSVTQSKENFVRRKSIRRKLAQVDFATSSHDVATTIRAAQFPLTDEMLGSLVAFCFPDNYFITKTKPPADRIHHLVLTNIVGTRTYATCLTHYEPYCVVLGKDKTWKCVRRSVYKPADDEQYSEAYIPCCYVVISKYPYFTVLKDSLSRLIVRLQQNRADWDGIVKEFTLQLCSTPVTASVDFRLEFQLFGVVMSLPSPSVEGQKVIDFNLAVVFQCLDLQTILYIVTALLLQQRIVFVSASYALLTIISESFMHFIYPFRWQMTYVPLLPLSLLELLEAPGTFVMGCHSRHWQLLNSDQFSGLVVVNVDQGTLKPPQSADIPYLPKSACVMFKDAAKAVINQLDLWRLETPTTFSYEESRQLDLQHSRKSNAIIGRLFADLMTNLFGSVLLHFARERRFFNREQFLAGVDDTDRPFYEKVFKTDLFGDFLKDRMANGDDMWSGIVKQLRVSRGSFASLSLSLSESTHGAVLTRNSLSLPSLSDIEPYLDNGHLESSGDTIVYRLPNFMYGLSHQYIETCLQDISRHIANMEQSSRLPSAFLYMRSAIFVALHRYTDALNDLCQLHSAGCRLFHPTLVSNILDSMTAPELEALVASDLYRRVQILREIQQQRYVMHAASSQPIVMELNKIPQHQIDVHGFKQLLELLQICSEIDVVERLFAALTVGRSQVVDPATFEEFYKCWKRNEVEVQQIVLSDSDTKFDRDKESVIKVSGLVKCTHGSGRIILTDQRLLFIQEGSSKCREAVRLADIRKIDQVPQFFLKKSLNLQIDYVRANDEKQKRFVASFRDQSQTWFLFVNEISAGQKLSVKHCDPVFVEKAKQNVLIVDAFISSGETEFTSHHKEVMEIAPSLCYFMAKAAVNCPLDKLAAVTSDALLRKLDVTALNPEPLAVDGLLYTFGVSSAIPSRLWCALSNWKMVVYNTETWQIDCDSIELGNRVTCMLETCSGQVWAGSLDSAIYTISNKPSLKNFDCLFEHCDSIADMTSDTVGSLYSASVNGHVIVWDSKSNKKVNSFELKLDNSSNSSNASESTTSGDILRKICCRNNQLLCCTKQQVLVTSLNGTVLNRVSIDVDCGSIQAEIRCFLMGPNEKLWIGLGKTGRVYIYDVESFQQQFEIDVPCRGISTMILVDNQVWIGTKQGEIYVFDGTSYKQETEYKVHKDRVYCAAVAHGVCIFTASGSTDGIIAVWKWP